MVRTRQPRIDSAREIIEQEREFIEREQSAFEQFRARLAEISTGAPDPGHADSASVGGGAVTKPPRTKTTALTHRGSTQTGRLRAVRDAYRETVMAVSHYDQEYGDTVEESMAVEFGETLAGLVVDGQVLTPGLLESLREGTTRALENRSEFCRTLDREQDSVDDIGTELNDIEAELVGLAERIDDSTPSARLSDVDDSLAILEGRCERLAEGRQQTIHDRSARELAGVDDVSLVHYLYAGELSTVTPVLADITDCLDAIRHQRRRCLR